MQTNRNITQIGEMYRTCSGPKGNFPPTDLYNEGWMLRLVLDWFSKNPDIQHELSFLPGDSWYSEALIPTIFKSTKRGDKRGESWTHVDGVIGNFKIGRAGSADLSLTDEASRLIVTEAKMSSGLSAGVKNASYFNQAARNVACIAETIHRSGILPTDFSKIGFYVIAPVAQINNGKFKKHVDRTQIQKIVEQRVVEYGDTATDEWLSNWFIPVLKRIELGEISWEQIIAFIRKVEPNSGNDIQEFYENCLKFN